MFTKVLILVVVDPCAPPPVRLTVHCIAAGSLIEAAKEKKKYTGRKSVINKDLIKTVEKYKDLGVSVTEIARITGKSRSTIYKVLKEELGYISNRLIKPEEVHESN